MRRLGGAVLSVVVLAAGGVLAAAPPAAADPAFPVPDTATIEIVGDGAGHGKGLSQYGAYGAGRAGEKVGEILDFYYPGTERGSVAGKVKVLLSADDDRSLVVEHRRGLTVRDLATDRTRRLARAGATRWRVQPDDAGRAVVSYRTRRWHRFVVLRGDAEVAAGGKPVTLRTPDGPVAYRGALRSLGGRDDRVTVNVLPMEQYLRGVVPAEMPAGWPQHALRAQAVAARTYAAYEREHTSRTTYHLCDTAACQAYGGASAETDPTDTAVARTARRTLTWQGGLAFAQHSASNGGWTVDGGRPYLPAQEDPHEGESGDYYGWPREVTAASIEDVYNLENLTEIRIEDRDGRGRRGGRVETVRLHSSTGWTGTVTGESFRRNFGLPSTLFQITGVS